MVTEEQLVEIGVDVPDTMERFGGNMELLERLLRLFTQSDALDGMLMAFSAQNPDDLERTSHSIKGSAANLGLKELSTRASDVCEYVRATRTAEVPQDLIDAVVEEHSRVTKAIDAL